MPLISREDGGTVAVQGLFPGDSTPMGAILNPMTHRAGRFGLTIFAAAAIAWPLLTAPAQARGPDGIADVAEAVIDAVVNISTKQTVEMNTTAMPQLPPGSPFEEFFDEFFKNRQGQGGPGGSQTPRRVNSLGSGFIIDASGLVVTNNHVIADADEINVILNDGTTLKAEIVGRDTKTDLALLRVKPVKPLKAVKFGDSDKLRLGEWVIAIGNPFSLGGTVTAGIADSRSIKPARGALIAGIDDKGPAKPAGIEPGDVIVKFDGQDIKEMRDLPKIVAETPVGKDVEVTIIRKGNEEKKIVKLGRLEDEKKQAALTPKKNGAEEKTVVKKALGLDLANLTDELRKKHNIKDKVKGVLITGVDANSAAAEKRLSPGMVIAEVQQQPVGSADELQQRIEKLKKDGKKAVVLLVVTPDGDPSFVALSLQ